MKNIIKIEILITSLVEIQMKNMWTTPKLSSVLVTEFTLVLKE
jgi:hypothetical protein